MQHKNCLKMFFEIYFWQGKDNTKYIIIMLHSKTKTKLNLKADSRFKFNKKMAVALTSSLLLLSVVLVGGWYFFGGKQNGDIEKAKASELQSQVVAKPEAGIEAIDVSTLARAFNLFKFTPKELVQAELDSQLKENYITKRQYTHLEKIYELSKTQDSVDFTGLQQKSANGEF